MFRAIATGLVAALAVPCAGADDKADTKEPKLDGTWTVVKGERAGKAIPEGEIKGSVVTIKGNLISGTDKDKKEFFAATFKLDASAKPCKIMMVSKAPKDGEKADGVVEVSGGTMRLAYALPGGTTPTEFKAGDKQQYFELKWADAGRER